MLEVSCRLFELAFIHLPDVGKSVDELCEGTAYTPEYLADAEAKIPWDDFVHLVGRISTLVGGGEAFEKYLRDDYNYFSSSFFTRLYGSAANPTQLYYLMHWAQKVFIRAVSGHLEVLNSDHIRLTYVVPEELEWSEELWSAVRCSFQAAPRILGLPDAHVVVGSEASLRRREFDIMPPPSMGLWQRFRRAWDAFFQKPGAVAFVIAQQEQLERNCARLEHEMRKREEAEASLRQVQKLEVLGQLSGGIAHDFNNLLTVVVGNLELMRADADIPGPHQELIGDALRAAEAGSSLTASLLSFSRSTPTSQRLVDVRQALLAMRSMFSRILPPGVVVSQSLPNQSLFVELDRGQLHNALLNLALNASQAQNGRGFIAFRAYARDRDVVLEVGDQGPGMSAEVRMRATEPFFSTKPHGAGTGLGLSMVARFVESARGELEIDSRVGGGTTVRMVFPRPRTQSPQKTQSHPGPTLGTGERVVLLDDNRDVRHTVGESLRLLGYEVAAAGDGSLALELLDERSDLLVTDVVLAGDESGVDVARVARSRHPRLAILLITGYAPEEVHVDSSFPVLSKPFTMEQLGTRVKAILAQQRRASIGGTELRVEGRLENSADSPESRHKSSALLEL